MDNYHVVPRLTLKLRNNNLGCMVKIVLQLHILIEFSLSFGIKHTHTHTHTHIYINKLSRTKFFFSPIFSLFIVVIAKLALGTLG